MLPPLNCPSAQTALQSSMPLYPIISWYLGYLKCKMSKMERTPPPSVSPKLEEAATGCGATLEPPRHPPQRSHSVSKCCGSCFQKPNPLSSHLHSRHPVRTTSPSCRGRCPASPSGQSEPTPDLCQRGVTYTRYDHPSAPAPSGLPLFTPLTPGTPCSRQSPVIIIGSFV